MSREKQGELHVEVFSAGCREAMRVIESLAGPGMERREAWIRYSLF
jgi:hypothetical protein